jgi:hypothetical protein
MNFCYATVLFVYVRVQSNVQFTAFSVMVTSFSFAISMLSEVAQIFPRYTHIVYVRLRYTQNEFTCCTSTDARHHCNTVHICNVYIHQMEKTAYHCLKLVYCVHR